MRMKQVVIFIAPPGAGKGTQSDVLSERLGFYHLETSRIIEEKFRTTDSNDPVIKQERENFLSGKLMTPELVTGWVLEKIRELAAKDVSIVFSGSFRTAYEAKTETPVVEELYGNGKIKIFHITLSEEESVDRNSHRRLCKLHRHPIPNTPEFRDLTVCPHDGSPLVKRELDTPEVARKRYYEYLERTEPVLQYFRDRGYALIEIKGEQPIKNVTDDILQNFK